MSRWSIILVVVWTALALRIGFAVARGESLRDDLSLPTVILFVMTVLVGSRVWVALLRPKATSSEA